MKTKIYERNVTHVDSDTGEIICNTAGCTTILDNQKTRDEKKRDEYVKSHVLNFNKGESFVKMFTEVVYKLSFILTPKEFMVAM